MSELIIFLVVVLFIAFDIVLLVRWWRMTADVKRIREHLTLSDSKPKLTYLVAIGEQEKADKAALAMIVDYMMPIYYDRYNYGKIDAMNEYLANVLPKIDRLGITLPDYVRSGEAFVRYLNDKTGNNFGVMHSQPEPQN